MTVYDVFAITQYVRRRNYSVVYGDTGYAVEWVVRGGGGVAYRSKTCNTREQAMELALKWLAKHPMYRDTTEPSTRVGSYVGPGRRTA